MIRHVRAKLSCRACDSVVVAPSPDHAIARGRAGAGLLAPIAVSKYDDHLPPYRQAEIFAREGVNLETSTLSGWVGATAATLQPLIDALAAAVMATDTLHVDDTPVPVLAPGAGKTKTGRLWTYVRDERPFAGSRPPPPSATCAGAVLIRCFDDGRLALDNKPAERALRCVAIGRKNFLFAGSDAGGRRAAAMDSLIESAKLNGLNPQLYLADRLARIADHPARHIAELLPWNWQPVAARRAAA